MPRDFTHYDEDYPLDCGKPFRRDPDVEDYTDPLIVIFDSHAGGGYPETPPDTTPFPHPDERPAFSLRAWLRSLWERMTFRCPDDLVTRT